MPANEKGGETLQKVTTKPFSPEHRHTVEKMINKILDRDERYFGDDYEKLFSYLKATRRFPEDMIEEFRVEILDVYLDLDIGRRLSNGKPDISPPSSPPILRGNTDRSEFADSGVCDVGEDSQNGPHFDGEVDP
jgi:hypothetical protein